MDTSFGEVVGVWLGTHGGIRVGERNASNNNKKKTGTGRGELGDTLVFG